MIKVGINGFGRVGRVFYRIGLENKNVKWSLAAINDLYQPYEMAYLLKHDSVYGTIDSNVVADESSLYVDGDKIAYYNRKNISEVPWSKHGVDIVIESSGVESNVLSARKAIDNSALKKVVVTRGHSSVDCTIVMGVNESQYEAGKHAVISSSTCTGNAMAPVAKVINDVYGIKKGFITTVHPVLAYEKMVDGAYPKNPSLGRAATTIKTTDTAVAASVTAVLPDLEECFYDTNKSKPGISYRVPTAIVDSIEANILLKKETTKDDVNKTLDDYCDKEMSGILQASNGFQGKIPLVGIDYVKNSHSAIIEKYWTEVLGGDFLRVVLWHDNEWGYASRVNDLVHHIITDGF